MMLRGNWLFPTALAVILGGLSAWLERVSTVPLEPTHLDPALPQYEIYGMAGRRFDGHGRLREQLDAQRAWQLPDREDVYLQGAELRVSENGQPRYAVSGSRARYGIKTHLLDFDEGVVLRQFSDRQRPEAEVQTAALTVDTQAQTARTDAPVSFRFGQSHGTAQGLHYDHKTGKLDLPAQVKALIYDWKNHQ
ncbi:LPS export ABC transporter periplasmic protein LptC [Conchiformibius kuhniae]|uniref:LPS export ABC transporter periplasmic protein LptC n=1 Tax=Conchiformibius kuhniae TaxID=211502 RepID=A0A8T9MUG7_9NEIS|nr:LPS export ABC transporter periplasmic protein LptC [Conchiformibius kuhniae]UOP04929.1 LPS export ABC transporter periplasmic protein LptC [Conchiformibius kuhniae]